MYNIGVDLVNINRIKRLLERDKDAFLNKIFNKKEIDYIIKSNYKVETISGMFATKEAVSKAFKTGISKDLSWKDISVLHKETGQPYVVISEDVLSKLDEKNCKFDVSISHDTDYAVSFVIKY